MAFIIQSYTKERKIALEITTHAKHMTPFVKIKGK
jgi:hypothetical protein